MKTLFEVNGKIDLKKLAYSVLVPLLVGFGSSFFTRQAGVIYRGLTRPAFAPPVWLFAPVWTLLYILMGLAAYRIWMSGIDKPEIRQALVFDGVQLFFNFLWSVLFFGLQWRGVAFVEILILMVLLALVLVQFWKIDRSAAYLMLPYLLWVDFASLLNLEVWRLNR